MGFAAATLFVEQRTYVFITGRRQEELDEAVKAIGGNVIGVRHTSPSWLTLIGFTKPAMRRAANGIARAQPPCAGDDVPVRSPLDNVSI
jgi:hypothetical protein